MVPGTLLENTALEIIGYTVLLGDGYHQSSSVTLVSYPELSYHYCNTAAAYKELRQLKTKPFHLTSVHIMNVEAPAPPFS